MAYEDYEYSIKEGRPQEAYMFSGQGQTWYLTSFDREVTVNGNTYTPLPITRSEPQVTDDSMKSDLDITVPVNIDIVGDFIEYITESTVTVTIYRKHWDVDSWLTYWKGRVVNFTLGLETILHCESVFTSSKRPGLRAKYQLLCRHALYSKGVNLISLCEADIDTYAHSATITSAIGTSQVTLSLNSHGHNDAYWLGGILKYESYIYRYIYASAGDGLTLQLDRPLTLDVGATVTCYPGCNHTMADCESKFNNLVNFGGFPWIPDTNPFSSLSGRL